MQNFRASDRAAGTGDASYPLPTPMFQTRVPCLHRVTDHVCCQQRYNPKFHSSDSSTQSNTDTGNATEAKGYGERRGENWRSSEWLPNPGSSVQIVCHLQSPSLKLFGGTTDSQVAEAIHFDGREAVDHEVNVVAEQMLADPFGRRIQPLPTRYVPR